MKLVAHHGLESSKDLITCTMTGVERCLRIGLFEPLTQGCKFLFALVVIKQMESSDNGLYGIGTCRQNILQTAMGTACQQQAIDIESQLMTEIVVDIIPSGVLHIEILISFGHRMILRDMGYNVKAICHLLCMIYQDAPLSYPFGPLGRDAVQVTSFGEELSTDGIG